MRRLAPLLLAAALLTGCGDGRLLEDPLRDENGAGVDGPDGVRQVEPGQVGASLDPDRG